MPSDGFPSEGWPGKELRDTSYIVIISFKRKSHLISCRIR